MPENAKVKFTRDRGDALIVVLAGSWRAVDHVPSAGEVEKQIGSAAGVRQIGFDSSALAAWDGGILPFLLKLVALTNERKVDLNLAGLPEGARNLLKLALAVPERKGARRTAAAQSILVGVGNAAIAAWREFGETIAFIGDQTLGLLRFMRGRAGSSLPTSLIIRASTSPSTVPTRSRAGHCIW